MPPLSEPSARRVLAAGIGVLVLLGACVAFLARPQHSGTRVIEVEEDPSSVAVVVVSVDDIDPNRGTAKVVVSAQEGPSPLPPEGATVVTGLPGVQPLVLPGTELTASSTSEVLLTGGDVGDYPFDRYELSAPVAVVRGTVTARTDPGSLDFLPMTLVATAALNGFDASAEAATVEGISGLRVELDRTLPIVVWASAMMAIFWLLAIGAAAVALAIVIGIRPFETRHLAWLTALLFAFAAFRGTAPGEPPIGVFLDFGSFFWAVAIIVTTELVLLACYLFGGDRWRPR